MKERIIGEQIPSVTGIKKIGIFKNLKIYNFQGCVWNAKLYICHLFKLFKCPNFLDFQMKSLKISVTFIL
jgi:hypothetical protein